TVDGGAPMAVVNARVSANFFGMLGIAPSAGRLFADGDDARGAGQVAVMSDGLWARVFNRDPNAIGRQIRLGGATVEIVGVVPADVRVPRQGQIQTMAFGDLDADVWTPFVVSDSDLSKLSEFDYGCIGRMKAGVTPSTARADLDVIEADIARTFGG